MTACINMTIEIPNVTAQPIEYKYLIDRERTAGFKLRQDRLGILVPRRTWRIECVAITKTQYDAIVAALINNPVQFWIDELGGTPETNSILVWIEIEEDERLQIDQRHNLVLQVIE